MLLDHTETVALALSFKVSLVGVACSLPVAIGCAWLLARRRFFGKPLFEGLLLLPLILPPVVTGYVLLIVFGHHGAIGRWLDAAGLSIAFRWTGAALAAAVMAFPLLVVALRNAFESVDRRLENAAATLGASGRQTFWRIIFPLLGPMSATVGIFAFLYAWNDFMMPSLIISDPSLQTLPVRQNLFQNQFSSNYNVAFASYLMAMAPAIVAYLFTQRWVMEGVTQGAVKG